MFLLTLLFFFLSRSVRGATCSISTDTDSKHAVVISTYCSTGARAPENMIFSVGEPDLARTDCMMDSNRGKVSPFFIESFFFLNDTTSCGEGIFTLSNAGAESVSQELLIYSGLIQDGVIVSVTHVARAVTRWTTYMSGSATLSMVGTEIVGDVVEILNPMSLEIRQTDNTPLPGVVVRSSAVRVIARSKGPIQHIPRTIYGCDSTDGVGSHDFSDPDEGICSGCIPSATCIKYYLMSDDSSSSIPEYDMVVMDSSVEGGEGVSNVILDLNAPDDSLYWSIFMTVEIPFGGGQRRVLEIVEVGGSLSSHSSLSFGAAEEEPFESFTENERTAIFAVSAFSFGSWVVFGLWVAVSDELWGLPQPTRIAAAMFFLAAIISAFVVSLADVDDSATEWISIFFLVTLVLPVIWFAGMCQRRIFHGKDIRFSELPAEPHRGEMSDYALARQFLDASGLHEITCRSADVGMTAGEIVQCALNVGPLESPEMARKIEEMVEEYKFSGKVPLPRDVAKISEGPHTHHMQDESLERSLRNLVTAMRGGSSEPLSARERLRVDSDLKAPEGLSYQSSAAIPPGTAVSGRVVLFNSSAKEAKREIAQLWDALRSCSGRDVATDCDPIIREQKLKDHPGTIVIPRRDYNELFGRLFDFFTTNFGSVSGAGAPPEIWIIWGDWQNETIASKDGFAIHLNSKAPKAAHEFMHALLMEKYPPLRLRNHEEAVAGALAMMKGEMTLRQVAAIIDACCRKPPREGARHFSLFDEKKINVEEITPKRRAMIFSPDQSSFASFAWALESDGKVKLDTIVISKHNFTDSGTPMDEELLIAEFARILSGQPAPRKTKTPEAKADNWNVIARTYALEQENETNISGVPDALFFHLSNHIANGSGTQKGFLWLTGMLVRFLDRPRSNAWTMSAGLEKVPYEKKLAFEKIGEIRDEIDSVNEDHDSDHPGLHFAHIFNMFKWEEGDFDQMEFSVHGYLLSVDEKNKKGGVPWIEIMTENVQHLIEIGTQIGSNEKKSNSSPSQKAPGKSAQQFSDPSDDNYRKVEELLKGDRKALNTAIATGASKKLAKVNWDFQKLKDIFKKSIYFVDRSKEDGKFVYCVKFKTG